MADPTIADVEDELYGAPPDEFVRRRKEAVQAARSRGDRDLADAVGALRKPTAAAWALDSFVRADGNALDDLLAVGARLRDAVDRGDGDEIRARMRERARSIADVMRRLRRHADQRGEPLSGPVAAQIEQTLRAAMADDDAGALVRRGVLAAALPEPGLGAMAPVGTPTRDEAPSQETAATDGPARERAAERREREAQEAIERVEAELDELVVRREGLDDEARRLRDRLDVVEAELRSSRDAESDAEARLRDARARRRSARAALRRARPDGA